MATSAWAEVKTLKCKFVSIVGTYAFDPELSNGESRLWNKIVPMKVTAFPNYYRLSYRDPVGENAWYDYIVNISRVDLSSTLDKKTMLVGDVFEQTNQNGQCKFIESAKKLF